MDTLLLDRDLWDWVLDSSGNWAVASPPYAIAQDVASVVRTFLGEVYYNTALGIPYFENVLGKRLPMSLVKQYVAQAALTVPGVTKANCLIASFSKDRVLTGVIEVTDSMGTTTVTF